MSGIAFQFWGCRDESICMSLGAASPVVSWTIHAGSAISPAVGTENLIPGDGRVGMILERRWSSF